MVVLPMRMWLPVRAMTRIWRWTIPGLIALEPAAMALHVQNQVPGPTSRNLPRVKGFGK